jgi:hypothetical protein
MKNTFKDEEEITSDVENHIPSRNNIVSYPLVDHSIMFKIVEVNPGISIADMLNQYATMRFESDNAG